MKITPKQSKNIKIGVGVLLTAIIAYLALKPKKQDTGGLPYDPTNNNDTGSGNNNTGSGNTYLFDPVVTAEKLYKAMKDIGTDVPKIFEALKNVNQTQFKQVIDAFGERNYNFVTGNTMSFVKHPLVYWLDSELSSSDYETLALKYPNYL